MPYAVKWVLTFIGVVVLICSPALLAMGLIYYPWVAGPLLIVLIAGGITQTIMSDNRIGGW